LFVRKPQRNKEIDVRKYLIVLMSLALIPATLHAGEDPIAKRQDTMEETRDALKPLGAMVKGERAFDAAVVESSFKTWKHTAMTVGDLFPVGSETGGDTEAKSTIWSDREGFDAALANFGEAVDTAIAADPKSVEELKPVLGGVTKACKGCHDDYRVEDDD
jgi:cytochrome c556